MHFTILTEGQKPPKFIIDGFETYAKRFSYPYTLSLKESKNIAPMLPPKGLIVALEVDGKQWDTPTLAQKITHWQQEHTEVIFLIGGPDGLPEALKKRAALLWSFSPLTFPHAFMRLLLAEQLYRACSILKQHPYHRA